jgi:hypothetical protein
LKGWLPYLWREWITSVDHKRIGIMYILLAMLLLLRGFSDAIMMRSQQALAFQSPGYLPPEHYDQILLLRPSRRPLSLVRMPCRSSSASKAPMEPSSFARPRGLAARMAAALPR